MLNINEKSDNMTEIGFCQLDGKLKTSERTPFLFSAHISYGKGKYLNQTGEAPNLYSTLTVLPIEFNSHKFSFVRYVFAEIFALFWE